MSKKSLLIMPLLLIAAHASAQSTVTIYGTVDLAVTQGRGTVAKRTSLSSGNVSTSKLGFRGEEDLGSGYKAGFWLEGGIFADTGTGFTTTTNNQPSTLTTAGGLVWNREALVTLSAPWGRVWMGRETLPHYYNLQAYDPFNHIGIGIPVFIPPNTNVAFVRASNTIEYFTPDLGGFYGVGAVFLGEQPKNGAANENDGDGHSVRLGYKTAAFETSFAHWRTKYATGNVANMSAGASYDFTIFKIGGVMLWDKRDAPTPDARGWEVALTAPVGLGVVKATYSTYKTEAATQPKSSKFALGYVYSLSKRTALYAHTAYLTNRGGATQSIAGSVTGANGNSSGYELGMRHNF